MCCRWCDKHFNNRAVYPNRSACCVHDRWIYQLDLFLHHWHDLSVYCGIYEHLLSFLLTYGYSVFYYSEFHKAIVFLQDTRPYHADYVKTIKWWYLLITFWWELFKTKWNLHFDFNELLFLNLSQNGLKQYCFLVFLVVCCLVATYIFFVVPETKNKTFLEIQSEFHSRKKLIAANGTEGPLLSTPM